jgi:acetyl-CoA C-acetyltransferase
MSSSYLVSGCRTPIGKFLGGLASFSAPQLGGLSLKETLARAGAMPGELDQVIMGEVVAAGAGQAPARQALLHAGIPDTIGAITVNKVCGSGLAAVMLADAMIRAGDASQIAAGGMESMSQAPHLLRGTRAGWKYGPQRVDDALETDGLRCAIGQASMGCYADATAAKYGVSRADQDAWSLQSHQRAIAAQQAGLWNDEVITVTDTSGKAPRTIAADEAPRADSTLEALTKLRPAFDASGTATAGNSSPLSDGAASVLVVNEQRAKASKFPWQFRIAAQANSAGPPSELFVAPAEAIRLALKRAGKSIADIQLFEINEAFASQTLACQRLLEIPLDRLNIHGGAIALGHPIGASGARVLVTLLHALVATKQTWGVASLCLGGGEAVALVVERTN